MFQIGGFMSSEIAESKMQEVLNFAYSRAVNGIAGLDSAKELAESYKSDSGTTYEQCNSLIQWQNTKAATSGFLTGVGGLILMPVTLPANITSVLYIQIRMIAAIAHLSGYDLEDDRVKTMVYVCLVGSAASEILKDAGIVIGMKLANNAVKNISGKVIIQINQKVGFRLLTKFGEKGVVNIGKAIPLAGGLVGGTLDLVGTNIIGNKARDLFVGNEMNINIQEDTAKYPLITNDKGTLNMQEKNSARELIEVEIDNDGWSNVEPETSIDHTSLAISLVNNTVDTSGKVIGTAVVETSKILEVTITELGNITKDIIPAASQIIIHTITCFKDINISLVKLADERMKDTQNTNRLKILLESIDRENEMAFKSIESLHALIANEKDDQVRKKLADSLSIAGNALYAAQNNVIPRMKALLTNESH